MSAIQTTNILAVPSSSTSSSQPSQQHQPQSFVSFPSSSSSSSQPVLHSSSPPRAKRDHWKGPRRLAPSKEDRSENGIVHKERARSMALGLVEPRQMTVKETEFVNHLGRLQYFLATAPSHWRTGPQPPYALPGAAPPPILPTDISAESDTSFDISTSGSERKDLRDLSDAKFLKNLAFRAPMSSPHPAINRFLLPNGENVSCVLWSGLYHISGTDIIRALVYRFEAFARPVINMKKFEEGVFSDLRNLKPGTDACLEDPKSPFLDLLFKHQCIRTQKKQKVFFWFSVPHDRLFLDALERDLKREKAGLKPTTSVIGEPARSFRYDVRKSLYEQFAANNTGLAAFQPPTDTVYHPPVLEKEKLMHPSNTTPMTYKAIDSSSIQSTSFNEPRGNPVPNESLQTISFGPSAHDHIPYNSNRAFSVLGGSQGTTASLTGNHVGNDLETSSKDNSDPRPLSRRNCSKLLNPEDSTNQFSEPYRPIEDSSGLATLALASAPLDPMPVIQDPSPHTSLVHPSAYDSNHSHPFTLSVPTDSSSYKSIRSQPMVATVSNPSTYATTSTFNPSSSLPPVTRGRLSLTQQRKSIIQPTLDPNDQTIIPTIVSHKVHPTPPSHPGGVRTFACPLPSCGKHFKRLEHLKRHLRTHTMEKPYGCETCGKKFSRSDNLMQHAKTHEKTDKDKDKTKGKDDRQREPGAGLAPSGFKDQTGMDRDWTLGLTTSNMESSSFGVWNKGGNESGDSKSNNKRERPVSQIGQGLEIFEGSEDDAGDLDEKDDEKGGEDDREAGPTKGESGTDDERQHHQRQDQQQKRRKHGSQVEFISHRLNGPYPQPPPYTEMETRVNYSPSRAHYSLSQDPYIHHNIVIPGPPPPAAVGYLDFNQQGYPISSVSNSIDTGRYVRDGYHTSAPTTAIATVLDEYPNGSYDHSALPLPLVASSSVHAPYQPPAPLTLQPLTFGDPALPTKSPKLTTSPFSAQSSSTFIPPPPGFSQSRFRSTKGSKSARLSVDLNGASHKQEKFVQPMVIEQPGGFLGTTNNLSNQPYDSRRAYESLDPTQARPQSQPHTYALPQLHFQHPPPSQKPIGESLRGRYPVAHTQPLSSNTMTSSLPTGGIYDPTGNTSLTGLGNESYAMQLNTNVNGVYAPEIYYQQPQLQASGQQLHPQPQSDVGSASDLSNGSYGVRGNWS